MSENKEENKIENTKEDNINAILKKIVIGVKAFMVVLGLVIIYTSLYIGFHISESLNKVIDVEKQITLIAPYMNEVENNLVNGKFPEKLNTPHKFNVSEKEIIVTGYKNGTVYLNMMEEVGNNFNLFHKMLIMRPYINNKTGEVTWSCFYVQPGVMPEGDKNNCVKTSKSIQSRKKQKVQENRVVDLAPELWDNKEILLKAYKLLGKDLNKIEKAILEDSKQNKKS